MRHARPTVAQWELTRAQDVLDDDIHVPVPAFGSHPMMEFKPVTVCHGDRDRPDWTAPPIRPVRAAVDTPVP